MPRAVSTPTLFLAGGSEADGGSRASPAESTPETHFRAGFRYHLPVKCRHPLTMEVMAELTLPIAFERLSGYRVFYSKLLGQTSP